MMQMTLEHYRFTMGSECNILHCDECKSHALDNNIEIVSPEDLPMMTHYAHLLLRTGRALNLTFQDTIHIAKNLSRYGSGPMIISHEDIIAALMWAFTKGRTIREHRDMMFELTEAMEEYVAFTQ